MDIGSWSSYTLRDEGITVFSSWSSAFSILVWRHVARSKWKKSQQSYRSYVTLLASLTTRPRSGKSRSMSAESGGSMAMTIRVSVT